MVSDRFSLFLEELGQVMQLKLAPDSHESCMLRFPGNLEVRIDPDQLGETIYLTCDLGPLPQGKYRENIFREALKANGLPPPRIGVFSFNSHRESLLLFDQIPVV